MFFIFRRLPPILTSAVSNVIVRLFFFQSDGNSHITQISASYRINIAISLVKFLNVPLSVAAFDAEGRLHGLQSLAFPGGCSKEV